MRAMTYDVQMFKKFDEGHLTKELNKRAADGWQIVSTAVGGHPLPYFIVTWGRAGS